MSNDKTIDNANIDKDAVKKAARLARIKIDDGEIDSLQRDMASIVNWFGQLSQVNTENTVAISHPHYLPNHSRADEIFEHNFKDEVLANAPAELEGFFAVPKIIE